MYKKLRLLTTMLLLAVCCGVWAEEVAYQTLTFPDGNNSKVSSYTATWTVTIGDFNWALYNFNNNNNGWSYVKCGRKNNASVGQIETLSLVDKAITKVVVTVDNATTSLVNSTYLEVSADNNFTNPQRITVDMISNGDLTYNVTTPTENQYYRLTYDCKSGTANGIVQISKVVLYYNNGEGSTPTETCANPSFSPAGGTYTSSQSVSLSCATDGASIYYRIDGAEPTADTTDGSQLYSSPITVNVNMTIKAIAVKEGMENSAVADATYTIVNIEHAGTEADPYTVADARAAIDANTGITNVYATGIVSKIVTAYNSQYGNITYNISADGTTTADQLEVYRGKSYNGDNFTSDDDIQVGDVVVVYGTLQKYGNTYEFAQDNQLVSLQRPVITTPSISLSENTINATADGAEGTINVTYNNITDVLADVKFYEADGETEASYDWLEAEINTDNNLDYVIDSNSGEARTAYMKVYALDDDANEVYSELITISQDAYVAPVIPTGNSYVKVTSTDDITTGQYLIVYEGDENHSAVAFNGGLETLDAANNTIGVTIENNEIAATTATEAAEFTIDATDGTIKSASGYYVGQTSDANGMNTSTETAYTNTISIDDEGNAVILASGGAYLRYNSASNQERFRYYKSTSYTNQKAIQLYKKSQAAASTATITLNAACHDADGMVYGTYSNTSAFVVSADITVAEVGIVDGKLFVDEYETGAVVPANTGVMVSAMEGGDYTVTLTDEEGTSVLGNDNMLRPTGAGITAEQMAEKDPACLYYRLTMHNGTQIGFWWGADEGAAFDVAANKAYLAVPAENGSKIQGFTFGNGGDATEIVLNALKGEQNGEMYNLQGQKVGSEYKGIVIVNGKKVMVK